MNREIRTEKSWKSLLLSGLLVSMVGCGGSSSSSSDDDNSEAVVARGEITQLGSIHVGGVKYETPEGGTYSDDDSTSGAAAYQVGQVVSIRGRRNDDGVSGVADEVSYEAEIEGELSGGTIHGISIVATPTTNGPNLSNGNRYEVSGIWIDDSTLEATFVKADDDGDGEDEIKGFVKNLGGGSFDVRSITFTGFAGTPDLVDGDYVEVHFNPATCSAPPVSCTLTRVELEDDFFDAAEGLEVEIEGSVDLDTSGCPAAAEFKIDGTCIDSSSEPAEWMDGLNAFADLVQGSRVEAEGHMVAGTPRDYLRADKVKGRGNRVRVSSFVSDKTGTAASGAFKLLLGNIDVTVSAVTEYDDTSFADIDVTANTRIEVRGVRTGPKSMLALRVKLEDDDDDKADEHELRAEVDLNGANSNAGSITVMQVTATGDGNTELELDDDIVFVGTLSEFLSLIDDNDNPADGSRDIVEVEIDSSGPFYASEIEIEDQDD